jgi:hypothetical protein
MIQEIPSAPYEVVGNIDEACRPEGVVLESSVRMTERDGKGRSGPVFKKGREDDVENIGIGGPDPGAVIFNEVAGLINPGSEAVLLGLEPGRVDSGQLDLEPPFLGVLVDDGVGRFSSLSEPEEVISTFRSKNSKSNPRNRKQKPGGNANKLGVPKCLKLAEAVKEMGVRLRKIKQKEMEVAKNKGDGEEVGVVSNRVEQVEATQVDRPEPVGRIEAGCGSKRGVSTPSSGLNLLSGSDLSVVPDTLDQNGGEDKEQLVAAAKLLSIQKVVGFNFEEPDKVTISHLIDQERSDRIKKKEWESREGDQ